jgi:hypothetical protein
MVTARTEHEIDWLVPAPLWGIGGVNLRAPVVARIDGDDFMARFAQMLAPGQPSGVALWNARAGAADPVKTTNTLYQAVHGCYALVCASLTCRAAGRPERAVAPTRESVGFVLRRVEADNSESAWVPAGSGEGAWLPANGSLPLDGEEVIPLFPVPVPGSPARRIWAGLVPTASRETYYRAPAPTVPPDPTQDPRIAELNDGPLTALQVPAIAGTSAAYEAALQAALALDEFIDKYILPLDGIAKGDIAGLLAAPGLGTTLASAGLAGAMGQAWAEQGYLLGTKTPRPDPYPTGSSGLVLPLDGTVSSVRDAIVAALPPLRQPGTPTSDSAHPKYDLALDPLDPVQQYVIRCVYLRPKCPVVASAASDRFAIAPVHDPEAPARTVRIPMPVDVSVAGLQKFKKNVGFVLSAALNAKASAFSGKKLKDIDDGNVSAGGPGLGEICTFALPIITLCAMIVLFIFLALLNIVFFWMPLLKICFPIPKGKPS